MNHPSNVDVNDDDDQTEQTQGNLSGISAKENQKYFRPQLSSGNKFWDPYSYNSKFNPHLSKVLGTHPLSYMMHGFGGPYGNLLTNPMMNPMMMNPYMMGMGMFGMGMGMMGGMGMMIPGMSMYPFMNPYMGCFGPYGPNSPYNSGERRLSEINPQKIKKI